MTRGEIWWTDVVVPLATNLALAEAPGNMVLEEQETGLSRDSVLVTSQIAAVDRRRLVDRVSKLDNRLFGEVEEGLRIVLGMTSLNQRTIHPKHLR